MSHRSGREAGGASASRSFHVMLTPNRSLLRHSTFTKESSQTGMETEDPAVFTCTEMQTGFRNAKPGASFAEPTPGTKTGLSYCWRRSQRDQDCPLTWELTPG